MPRKQPFCSLTLAPSPLSLAKSRPISCQNCRAKPIVRRIWRPARISIKYLPTMKFLRRIPSMRPCSRSACDNSLRLARGCGQLWGKCSEEQERMRRLREELRRASPIAQGARPIRRRQHRPRHLLQKKSALLDIRVGTLPRSNIQRFEEALGLAGYIAIHVLHQRRTGAHDHCGHHRTGARKSSACSRLLAGEQWTFPPSFAVVPTRCAGS